MRLYGRHLRLQETTILDFGLFWGFHRWAHMQRGQVKGPPDSGTNAIKQSLAMVATQSCRACFSPNRCIVSTPTKTWTGHCSCLCLAQHTLALLSVEFVNHQLCRW
uniref:Uncharacterized protein n=1 Tax=Eutreptiella gymnastica TaxID=73025 RepID=A0A7S1N9Q8_9EUGL